MGAITMKLNPSSKSFLFSSTEIPDIFFTDYLPVAKSEFVKVYFYVLFLANHNSEVKINDLSKNQMAIPSLICKNWNSINYTVQKSAFHLRRLRKVLKRNIAPR